MLIQKLVWSPTPRRHAGTWCWAVGFHSQQHDEIVTSVSIFTLGLTTRVLLLLSINTAQHLQDLMIATSATMNRSAPRLLRATWQHRFPLSPSLALSGQRLVGNRTLSASTTALPKAALNTSSGSQPLVNKWWARAGAIGLGLGVAQYQFGSAENFFEHSFVTNKACQDLAGECGSGSQSKRFAHPVCLASATILTYCPTCFRLLRHGRLYGNLLHFPVRPELYDAPS